MQVPQEVDFRDMRMLAATVILSLCNLVAAEQVGTITAAKSDPLQVLIALVGESSAEGLKEAEEANAALLKIGKPATAATYALALIYTRENRYEDAVKTLDSLPNDAKLVPPIIRLRLYLALERGEKRLAESLIPLLQSQVDNDKTPLSERLDSARLLGGIVGAISPTDIAALSPEVVCETVRGLTDAKEAKISNVFRSAQSEASKRRAKLTLLVAEAGDKANVEQALLATEKEESAAIESLRTTKDKFTVANRENQKLHNELTGPLRKLGQQIRKIEHEWELPTPGRPQEPQKPREVREPQRPTGNDPNAAAEYQRKLRDYYHYLDALRDYPRKLEIYRQYLQMWQQIDQQRRANLRTARQAAETEVATVRDPEQKSQQKIDELREETKSQETALQDIQLKLIALRNISIGAGGEENRSLLSRPSNYGLLSFPAERQRLLQATR